jgi:hypothetical protein
MEAYLLLVERSPYPRLSAAVTHQDDGGPGLTRYRLGPPSTNEGGDHVTGWHHRGTPLIRLLARLG